MIRSRDQFPSTSRPRAAGPPRHHALATADAPSPSTPVRTLSGEAKERLFAEWDYQNRVALAELDKRRQTNANINHSLGAANMQVSSSVDQFNAVLQVEDTLLLQDEADAAAELERVNELLRMCGQFSEACKNKKNISVEQKALCERTASEEGEHTVIIQSQFEDRYSVLQASSLETETIALKKDESLALAEKYKDSAYGLTDEAAALVLEDERLHRVMEELRQRAIESEVERRQLFGTLEELKGTIRVYCRVKGSLEGDTGEVAKFAFPDGDDGRGSTASRKSADSATSASSETQARRLCQKRTLSITSTRRNATSTGTAEKAYNYEYDRVFGPQSSQADVFDEVSGLVDTAVDGYRVCVLAYGQTGSGKTHTMMGTAGSISGASSAIAETDPDPCSFEGSPTIQPLEGGEGIIPRAVHRVFSRIADLEQDGWTYEVTCYFVEIYNDMIRDLLSNNTASADANSASANSKLHRIEHIGRLDTTISNVKIVKVTRPSQIGAVLQRAHRARAVAATKLNDRSSRSHCVFTMRIEGINNSINQRSLGNLCLVDLAGSERINDSGVTGAAMAEAININKSLSFLGDCIVSLGSAGHVVWGNCKLTQLLQNYLGGEGSKVLMMVMLSDKEVHTQETINSLNFAKKVNQTRIGKAVKRVQNM